MLTVITFPFWFRFLGEERLAQKESAPSNLAFAFFAAMGHQIQKNTSGPSQDTSKRSDNKSKKPDTGSGRSVT
jgi:hypothetical protein